MGAALLAAIERLRKSSWAILAVLLISAIGALAQFTGAAKELVGMFTTAKPDPRSELAKLGIAYTPAAMVKAATDGDARAVGLLLDAGMPVDTALDPALTPLMLAAQSGSVEVAKRLLAAGADPARIGAAGTPLAYAARYGHPEVLKLFLGAKLPRAVIDDAFIVAGDQGQTAAIDLLAPRLADRRASATAALHALVVRSIDAPRDRIALAALLKLKPALEAIDDNGQTLLHLAVNNDATEMLRGLLAAGADPRVRGRCNTSSDDPLVTPLICASTRGSSIGLASANVLIGAHADLEARDPDGATPLMLAAEGGDRDMTAALLKAGADRLARDTKGRTALDYARSARFSDRAGTIAVLTQAAARPRS